MHADSLDWFLMILGLFGSISEGFSTPLVFLVASKLKNNLAGSYSVTDAFSDNINKSFLFFVFFSCLVPNFLKNCAIFVGCYIVAFLMLWRLTIVVLLFILLLVIPGVIYREILMRLSRKMKQEFSKAESRAEQAISSVRTICAFFGESKASSAYSAALQLPAKLGLRQGLARGLVVGNNGVVFAVWSFTSYYGSRMLIALGAGLSNMQCFADAFSAGERIMEVMVVEAAKASDAYNFICQFPPSRVFYSASISSEETIFSTIVSKIVGIELTRMDTGELWMFRLPAGYVGGYCSGSVGLDVFGLWEIRWFVLCSGLLHSSIVKGCWWLFKLNFFVAVGDLRLFVWWEIAAVVAVLQLEKNFVLARFVASGYLIFVPFILFHFIGLVAAAVLGFVRVSMLSRALVSSFSGLALLFFLLLGLLA
ncbi:hypothetical protein POTOM_017450 [Populus tomentosa]|uniref:ABC transmembrane type-1 domain-containing protein n=1 Tax=Populus tomentosa TaxID=118781 RepID=A0A8X8AAS0_POPTO|nr:hypothetical protein POTOM_017450 [Populus tomentosa]